MFKGRVVAHGEPQWLASDHALAVALAVYEGRQCPGGCGHPIDIAWNPDNDGYFAKSEEIICWACSARDEKEVRHPRGVVYTRDDDDPIRFDFDPWSPDPYAPKGGER